MRVVADDLLEGTVLALFQASESLADSYRLFARGRYANALALAVFSREEVGRCRVLLAARDEAAAGQEFTPTDVRQRCGDHVHKLRSSQSATYARLSPKQTAQYVGSLGDLEGPTYAAFRDALDRSHERGGRDAERLHKTRLLALYVDIGDDGRWNRPNDTTAATAHPVLAEAGVEYAQLWTKVFSAGLLAQAGRLGRSLPEPPPPWPLLTSHSVPDAGA